MTDPQAEKSPFSPAGVSFKKVQKGAEMHYFNWHIGDYKSHTHHLNLMEDIAYRRLLDHYYLHEVPIRQRDIARQIGMRDQEQDVLTVLNEFWTDTPEGYINPRADREIRVFKEHQAHSAWGAFVRDNPKIKNLASKEAFVEAFLIGKTEEYALTLSAHHVPIKGTSSTLDATNTHLPSPNSQFPRSQQMIKDHSVDKSKDPALQKLDRDSKLATPVPAAIRAKLAALRGSA